MPFWYHLPIPKLDGLHTPSVRLSEWLLPDGAEVHAGTKIAIIEIPMGKYAVAANGDGVLRERLFRVGAELEPLTPIAVIAADGENIPYGKPYSLAVRISDEKAER